MSSHLLLHLNVNGERFEVAAPSHWTLCEVLRYKLSLTGTKQGCDKGDCGACTVLIDGTPVLSCITLAAAIGANETNSRAITTIEGLKKESGLDPVQDAFDRCGALQCGFCQPGMMLSAKALLQGNSTPSTEQIKEAISGSLCRCTGYTKIIEAVQMAALRKVNPSLSSEDAFAQVRNQVQT
jgi:aerobic-type carbon monoxide dehydrogenase small subunit (CoxS/CutS family)